MRYCPLWPWQALVIRISRIDVVVLSIGNSSVVYYQECAKWDKKLPIENWKWCWWPSAESGFVGFRFQADRKRWEQIGFGSRLGCRRSCRRKLGGFHTSPDFIFFPANQRQKNAGYIVKREMRGDQCHVCLFSILQFLSKVNTQHEFEFSRQNHLKLLFALLPFFFVEFIEFALLIFQIFEFSRQKWVQYVLIY